MPALGHLLVRNMGAPGSLGHHYCDTSPCSRPLSPGGPVVLLGLGLLPRPRMAISKGHRPGRAQGHLTLGPPGILPPASPDLPVSCIMTRLDLRLRVSPS